MDAEHWVHWLLATQTFVLVLSMLWTFAMTLTHGVVLLTLVPATFVALSGWLTAAWRKERQWAWFVAAILFGMRFAGNLLDAATGTTGWLTVALLLFDGLLLAFLFHRDSFARARGTQSRVPGALVRHHVRVDPRS